GHVPFRKAELPEGVVTTGCDVRQVQARGTGATDAGGLACQAAEHAEIGIQVIHLPVAERKAGAQQCAFEALARADTQASPVECCTTTTAGGEFFLANRVEHYRVLEATTVFACNAHGIVRNAADEVGGAIQRIDDPEVISTFSGALRDPAFLAEDAVIGVRLAQRGHDQLFGGAVDLGDIILRVFLIYRDHVHALG